MVMKIQKFIFLTLSGLALLSCHPEPDTVKLADELVVETNYDPSADFKSYSTYAIATDTLGLIANTDPNDTLITTSEGNDFPRPVVQAIIKAMNERGYTRVARNENPDLGIKAVVVHDFNVFQQVIYPNYGGGYYSPYYGYSSWSYYPYVNTYTTRNAVLVIELVDLKTRTPDNKVKVVWYAYLGDLYTTIQLIEQTESAIDQAFKQSPFIGK
jgi:hypothetical protein